MVTPIEVQRVVAAAYAAGERSPVLAARHDVSLTTVRDIVRRHGGTVRAPQPRRRAHAVNDDAFADLGPDQRYWAGFLFADGSIRSTQGNVVSLSLAERDGEHVERFHSFIGSTHAITRRRASVCVSIPSLPMVERLAALGMRGPTIDPTLIDCRHFWRGVFDGDGCLGIYKRGPQLTLVGHKWLLIQFADMLLRNDIGQAIVKPKRNIFAVQLTTRNAASLARLLYESGDVALPRKAVIADEIRRLHY